MTQHRHHILPIRLGGTNDEENLTLPISTKLHAAFHKDLYEHYGMTEDYIAWKALEGRLTSEEARLMAAKAGQDKSERYKQSRKETGEIVKNSATPESRSKGGKNGSKKLVEWQKQNEKAFKKKCSDNGKIVGPKLYIPHEYEGIYYESKKALQEATGLSNCGFYNKLKRGEIKRLTRHLKEKDRELS